MTTKARRGIRLRLSGAVLVALAGAAVLSCATSIGALAQESGGHSTGGGHTSGGGATGGGHTSGGGATGGGHTSGGESGGGHSGGGASGGGHSGGGGTSGGGHSGGGGGEGGEKRWHGTRPGHEGHASGVHTDMPNAHGQTRGQGRTQSYGVSRRFAGGTGIWGGSQVPEGISNSSGQGYGPINRFRYWGGWSIPDYPLTPAGGGGGTYAFAPIVGDARCEDMSPGIIEPLSQKNWTRLGNAYDLLRRPGVEAKPPEREATMFTLAVYQFELMWDKPDATLAATYLAHASQVPLTADLVDKVNWRLCVAPKKPAANAAIATAGEAARTQRSGKSVN